MQRKLIKETGINIQWKIQQEMRENAWQGRVPLQASSEPLLEVPSGLGCISLACG